jgi:hypothetical protein
MILGGEDPSWEAILKFEFRATFRDALRKSEGWPDRWGREGGGDSIPNLDGTDDATGPYRAICDMPLLSNDAGRGASRAVKWRETGEIGSRESSPGEPYFDPGFGLMPVSIVGMRYGGYRSCDRAVSSWFGYAN